MLTTVLIYLQKLYLTLSKKLAVSQLSTGWTLSEG